MITFMSCPSKWGSQLEVLMRKDTELQKSPKKFNVTSLVCNTSNEITFNQLQDLNSYQRVVATVKVVSAQEVKEVKNGLRKQDYIVGDATGAATVIMWENNITLSLRNNFNPTYMLHLRMANRISLYN